MTLLSEKINITRCRPLLGTFVSISIDNLDPTIANIAIDHAFKTFLNIEHQMSIHSASSELSQLMTQALIRPTPVSPELYAVLSFAKTLYTLTEGVFDVCFSGGHAEHLYLESGTVFFSSPLTLDLGGIAKGFAVDQAMNTLLTYPVEVALINAGGDLRYCGEPVPDIWVPNPHILGQKIRLAEFKKAALATSSPNATHINGQTRQPVKHSFSVSVAADTCMIADSLTKVVLALGEKSAPLLTHFDAFAFIIPEPGDPNEK